MPQEILDQSQNSQLIYFKKLIFFTDLEKSISDGLYGNVLLFSSIYSPICQIRFQNDNPALIVQDAIEGGTVLKSAGRLVVWRVMQIRYAWRFSIELFLKNRADSFHDRELAQGVIFGKSYKIFVV
jgi:hypothetical protein